LTLALWTRRWFGPVAGLVALSLYCLDPNLTAHGRYAKNDVAAAGTIFLAAACWTEYLISKSRRWLWVSGLALGLALATKFSALVLLPAYPLLAWYARSRDRDFQALKSLLVVALGAAMVIFCAYNFEFESLHHSGFAYSISSRLPSFLSDLPLPASGFLRGLNTLGHKEVQGQSMGYLLGELSDSGWWYFPFVVLAVKMPLGVILLTMITVGLALYKRVPLALPSLRVAGMSLPVVLYFGASMITSQNAGIRHLLPLLPFLYMALGWFWAKRLESRSALTVAALTICGVTLAAENISIYPHYLAFFNAASGGPNHGAEYLIDSNLDWGQDAKNLAQYLSDRRVQEPCVRYFGMAELDYYGIQARPVPQAATAQDVNAIDCMVAVSASFLYRPDGMFDGLRERQPDARIGYSIYVYDLRKRK
jgi:4-amino-4-deoxy-L-arabinose transferase-like glycosyltransferase